MITPWLLLVCWIAGSVNVIPAALKFRLLFALSYSIFLLVLL